MNNIHIIPPNTTVKILDDIDGIINEVLIKPNQLVSYNVSWWDGRTRKSEWLYEHELHYDVPPERTIIGFANTDSVA